MARCCLSTVSLPVVEFGRIALGPAGPAEDPLGAKWRHLKSEAVLMLGSPGIRGRACRPVCIRSRGLLATEPLLLPAPLLLLLLDRGLQKLNHVQAGAVARDLQRPPLIGQWAVEAIIKWNSLEKLFVYPEDGHLSPRNTWRAGDSRPAQTSCQVRAQWPQTEERRERRP